ncbi:hypothetical protein [Bradyrhizobium erythrophlei]|nr:hypothetical protein [Bradyrhizobium erythrophlei]
MTRALGRLACLANANPWAAWAFLATIAVTLMGLMILGAVTLFTNASAPIFFLFAAATVAIWLALNSRP